MPALSAQELFTLMAYVVRGGPMALENVIEVLIMVVDYSDPVCQVDAQDVHILSGSQQPYPLWKYRWITSLNQPIEDYVVIHEDGKDRCLLTTKCAFATLLAQTGELAKKLRMEIIERERMINNDPPHERAERFFARLKAFGEKMNDRSDIPIE